MELETLPPEMNRKVSVRASPTSTPEAFTTPREMVAVARFRGKRVTKICVIGGVSLLLIASAGYFAYKYIKNKKK